MLSTTPSLVVRRTMSTTIMKTIKPHQLAPKSILDRRKSPSKKVTFAPQPATQPQTSFRRRLPVTSPYKALPLSNPETYLTEYKFPSMRPEQIRPFPSTFLRAPMRRDILHKAIVYEANLARGTGGHTKTRGEVRGSTRKIRQQKGTGMARVGARVAAGRRGGGITFGPRRRSFKTKLQRRVYSLAYRTAISYRFAQSQLLLTTPQYLAEPKTKYLLTLLRQLKWTKKAGGGTLFVTLKERKNLFKGARKLGGDVTVKTVKEIKVRDLLLMGRVVLEKKAFEWLVREHGVERKPHVLKKDPIRDYERLVKLL